MPLLMSSVNSSGLAEVIQTPSSITISINCRICWAHKTAVPAFRAVATSGVYRWRSLQMWQPVARITAITNADWPGIDCFWGHNHSHNLNKVRPHKKQQLYSYRQVILWKLIKRLWYDLCCMDCWKNLWKLSIDVPDVLQVPLSVLLNFMVMKRLGDLFSSDLSEGAKFYIYSF